MRTVPVSRSSPRQCLAFGLLFTFAFFSGVPVTAQAPSLGDTFLRIVCYDGLKALADAEKAEDASDSEKATRAYQNAIERYDDCIADPKRSHDSTLRLTEKRLYARVFLADHFISAGRFSDARNQFTRMALDLDTVCREFDLQPSSAKHEIRYLLAPAWAKWFRRYEGGDPSAIIAQCHVPPEMVP
jgi:hypothetical protein